MEVISLLLKFKCVTFFKSIKAFLLMDFILLPDRWNFIRFPRPWKIPLASSIVHDILLLFKCLKTHQLLEYKKHYLSMFITYKNFRFGKWSKASSSINEILLLLKTIFWRSSRYLNESAAIDSRRLKDISL